MGVACGRGLWAWPVGVACGRGMWAWPVGVACRRGLRAGPVDRADIRSYNAQSADKTSKLNMAERSDSIKSRTFKLFDKIGRYNNRSLDQNIVSAD